MYKLNNHYSSGNRKLYLHTLQYLYFLNNTVLGFYVRKQPKSCPLLNIHILSYTALYTNWCICDHNPEVKDTFHYNICDLVLGNKQFLFYVYKFVVPCRPVFKKIYVIYVNRRQIILFTISLQGLQGSPHLLQHLCPQDNIFLQGLLHIIESTSLLHGTL